MDLRQMRCVLAIAEAGSLMRAATRLGVAQPALTQTLNRVEQELGVRLFERTRRGTQLTEAGHAIVDDLRSAVAHGEAADARARAIGQGQAGRLVVGFVTHAVFQVLPRAMARLRAACPGVRVQLCEMSNAEQVQALERGSIDIALLHPPVAVGVAVHERRLEADTLVAVIPATDPLAGAAEVGLADFVPRGLVWFPEAQMPTLRAQIQGAFRQHGHAVEFVQEANRTLTVLACVASGVGWSLLPASVMALRHEGVAYARVRDGQALPAFLLSAMWRARSRPSLADTFAGLLQAQ